MIRLWYSWAQYYPRALERPEAERTNGADADHRLHRDAYGDAVLQHKAPRAGQRHGGHGPRSGQRRNRKGRPPRGRRDPENRERPKIRHPEPGSEQDLRERTFTVRPPQSLLWTPTAKDDPGYPLIGDKFQFSNEPEWHDPYEFSQQVYLIMASMNQIGKPNNNSVSKYMQDIIGANMGFIFTDAAKKEDDAQMVIAMIRDMIKSVLRGVSNFTKYPDVIDKEGNHTRWYPNPAKGEGGQLFNVFNLDPFVWFVHVRLGFSGYGFSVDDDTADIGAGGASQLQLTVTGTGGLKNTNPWTTRRLRVR